MKQAPYLAAAAMVAFVAVLFAPALAQHSPPSSKANTAFDPATLPDQEIGRRFAVKAEDLPPPKTGPAVASRPLTVPCGARPTSTQWVHCDAVRHRP